ncbi:uncharacterized protein DS421_20g695420 [Arachis hypogaea]|nr:uncharacterized protein DS421_20g695420 [Arachis hypogaea]
MESEFHPSLGQWVACWAEEEGFAVVGLGRISALSMKRKALALGFEKGFAVVGLGRNVGVAGVETQRRGWLAPWLGGGCAEGEIWRRESY